MNIDILDMLNESVKDVRISAAKFENELKVANISDSASVEIAIIDAINKQSEAIELLAKIVARMIIYEER